MTVSLRRGAPHASPISRSPVSSVQQCYRSCFPLFPAACSSSPLYMPIYVASSVPSSRTSLVPRISPPSHLIPITHISPSPAHLSHRALTSPSLFAAVLQNAPDLSRSSDAVAYCICIYTPPHAPRATR
ncbi:hypothetical protein C8Q70DRAFT_453115 [Cubamyces menziesii]|nr:hypothetical protein C8Q70DRAFT_453115 [Cubamyces menziesii]